jgi:RNA polymerase sigma factor (sigma-70 family)
MATKDLLGSYLNRIGRYPLLSKEQEIELGQIIQRGVAYLTVDNAQLAEEELKLKRAALAARDKMVRHNLRLVVAVVKKYWTTVSNRMELMDLVQAGNMGLQLGCERFDPTQGYRFSTYAYWWIRQSVTRCIKNHARIIRLPIYLTDRMTRLNALAAQMTVQQGRRPTPQELATEAGISLEELQELKHWVMISAPASLNCKVKQGHSAESEASELVDFLAAEAPDPYQKIDSSLITDQIQTLMEHLTERERTIIEYRYFLDEPETLQSLADNLGISRERIRQIERRALLKMRKAICRVPTLGKTLRQAV